MNALCVLCAERPAVVRVSWFDKAERLGGPVAQYKLCSECSQGELDEAKLLSMCDKHATAEQRRASRLAEQLKLFV